MFGSVSTHFYTKDRHFMIAADGETINCKLYDKSIFDPPLWKGTLEELAVILQDDKATKDRKSGACLLEIFEILARSGVIE